ncbi:MAG: nucleoside hydrolase [Oscillospiraceae bacterium]|jgi:inosine-uridine nucleoside N-ribohydrolase
MSQKFFDRSRYVGDRADDVIDDDIRILEMLKWPERKVDVVIDTDTFNEIDDQYAIAYALRSPDRMAVKAIYAAPFDNEKSGGPKRGMELSYNEIMNILSFMGEDELKKNVFKGSEMFMEEGRREPVKSAAADNLVERSKSYSRENPLYVIAIGAITNVASAILEDPSIVERIVLIWLGGHSFEWNSSHEFNMLQDVTSARVIFDSKVPLVLLPCMGVVSGFSTSQPELEHWMKGKSPLCDYLVDITIKEAAQFNKIPTWTRSIWDVTAVAWLVDKSFESDRIEHTPIDEYDDHYAADHSRHLMRYVYGVKRDKIFYDLFTKLAK